MAAFDWLTAIALVGTTEAVAALSYLPAYRHHWRLWYGIDWRAEWPYVWPPLFLNGALWFLAQLVNALGAWFVLRLDASAWPYHAVLSLWVVALGFWSLWAVPWEMEMPVWTVATWGGTSLLSGAAAAVAWAMTPRSLPGALLLTAYAAWMLFCFSCNALILFCRHHSTQPISAAQLHYRIGNPVAQWLSDGCWPPIYDGATAC